MATEEIDPGADALLQAALDRSEALGVLRDGPLTKPALQDALDVSRATNHRIVTSLAEQGLVERDDDAYALTGVGECIAAEIDRFEATVETVDRLGPTLDAVDVGRMDLDASVFRDATPLNADGSDPYEVLHGISEFVLEADSIRLLADVVGPPKYAEEITQRFADGMQGELIVTPAIARDMITERPRMNLRAFRSGNVDAWLCSDPPCNLIISDDRVCVAGTAPETGAPVAGFHTTAAPAREWADELFDRYRGKARSVNPRDYLPDGFDQG